MRANAAIFYAPEGYSTVGPRLMGRHAAGEGFLRAWLRHAEVPALFCYTRRKAHGEQFAQASREQAGREVQMSASQRSSGATTKRAIASIAECEAMVCVMPHRL